MRTPRTRRSTAPNAEAVFISWRHDRLAHPTCALPFVLGRFDTDRFRPLDWDLPAPLGNCVVKRQAEFVAGRICAREALMALGHNAVVLAIGAQREPVWPQGVLGSITHSADYAAAIVCDVGDLCGIGIDIEQAIDTPTRADLIGEVVSSAELARLSASETAESLNTLLTLVFSAKESFFKAAFPQVKRYFDFSAVELVGIDTPARTIRMCCVEHLSDRLQPGFTFEAGYHFLAPDCVMTMVALKNDSPNDQV